jgi:hypothetical protein
LNWAVCSHSGGPRAGATPDRGPGQAPGGAVGSPRSLRMERIAGWSMTKAMRRISPPHRAQRKGKTS